MRLGQIRWNGKPTAAIFEGGLARPIPDYDLYELICSSEKEGDPLPKMAQRLAAGHREPARPMIPLQPREVWGCGCTYASSAEFRDGERARDEKPGPSDGFYDRVYRGQRPEIFFKGTARICVGPGQPIGIRSDSKFTAAEPELAVVLGSAGRVLGYTLANDVSAWDIERENPLYLPQSKIYAGACALGPVMVTRDDLPGLYDLEIACTISRDGAAVFSGRASTSALNRKIEVLIEFLLRSNPVPAGSVLLTGTGIIVTEDAALAPGDIVSIRALEIGELVNTAAAV